MIRQRKDLFVLSLLLIATLPLIGCPRRPEVKEAVPGALAPLVPGPEMAKPTPPKEAPPAVHVPVPKPEEGVPTEAPTPPVAMVPPPVTEELVKKPEVIREMPVKPEEAIRPEAALRPEAPPPLEPPIGDIFFDFDKAMIREDMKMVLDENAGWLRANHGVRITIEGHCDERGTNEYNLALGERRARATREYLMAAGIDPNRIDMISFGEERPFVLGQDESAWKWNRRAHIIMAP